MDTAAADDPLDDPESPNPDDDVLGLSSFAGKMTVQGSNGQIADLAAAATAALNNSSQSATTSATPAVLSPSPSSLFRSAASRRSSISKSLLEGTITTDLAGNEMTLKIPHHRVSDKVAILERYEVGKKLGEYVRYSFCCV